MKWTINYCKHIECKCYTYTNKNKFYYQVIFIANIYKSIFLDCNGMKNLILILLYFLGVCITPSIKYLCDEKFSSYKVKKS